MGMVTYLFSGRGDGFGLGGSLGLEEPSSEPMIDGGRPTDLIDSVLSTFWETYLDSGGACGEGLA